MLVEKVPTAKDIRDPKRKHPVGSKIKPRDVGLGPSADEITARDAASLKAGEEELQRARRTPKKNPKDIARRKRYKKEKKEAAETSKKSHPGKRGREGVEPGKPIAPPSDRSACDPRHEKCVPAAPSAVKFPRKKKTIEEKKKKVKKESQELKEDNKEIEGGEIKRRTIVDGKETCTTHQIQSESKRWTSYEKEQKLFEAWRDYSMPREGVGVQ